MTQLIRILNDLHLEFSKGNMDIPHLDTDPETVLVLAGDIGLANKSTTFQYFIEDMSVRFKHIVYVLGNHEFYHANFPTAHSKIWNVLLDINNVDVLEKQSVVINGVAFIGATMWTDMYKMDPLCMESSRCSMNDYNIIRTGPEAEPWKRKLSPMDTILDHTAAVQYVFDEIVNQKQQGNKVVVVSHHAPCSLSIAEQYKTDIVSGAYYSDLSERILDTRPDVWCHGHVHNSCDYTIGDTRVICNPRGYAGIEAEHLNVNFNPSLLVAL